MKVGKQKMLAAGHSRDPDRRQPMLEYGRPIALGNPAKSRG